MTTLLKNTELKSGLPKLSINQKFLVLIAITFLFSMHYFMQNPGGVGLELPFNSMVWITIAAAMGVAFYLIATKGAIQYTKLTLVYLICCILLTLPAFYTLSSDFNATPRLIGLWVGWLFFLCLQQFRFSEPEKQIFLWLILFAALIEGGFGYIQYMLLDSGNIFGYDTEENRPYGIFQQPNVMASFLNTGLVVSGYLLTKIPRDQFRSKRYRLGILYLTPVLTIPLLIVLASRTGWLAALIGVGLLIPYLIQFSTAKRTTLWGGAIVVGLIIGFFLAVNGEGQGHIESKASLKGGREITFPQTIDMIVEKPLTGYGYGQFEAQYIYYTAYRHQLNPDYEVGMANLDHPHNELMLWAVEGGIVPVLAILLAAFATMQRIIASKKGTRLALFALCAPLVIHTQLEYPFYSSAIHWITFLILLYWIDQRNPDYHSVSLSGSSQNLIKVISFIAPLGVMLFMVTTLHTNYVLTKYETTFPKKPEILDQISNSLVWQNRLDWNIHVTLLNVGFSSKNNQIIQQYVDWSLQHIKFRPRREFYVNLIAAYTVMGMPEKAQQIEEEGRYFFPKHEFEQYVDSILQKVNPDLSSGSSAE